MDTFKMSEQNNELQKLLNEGKLTPKGDIEAEAVINETALEIQISDWNRVGSDFEAVILYWGTDDLKPIFMHEISTKNGFFSLDNYSIVQVKVGMQKRQNVRLCIALKTQDKYVCSYIFNSNYKDNAEETNEDIGKLATIAGDAFVAYWSNKGRLSFKYKNLEELEDTYYRCYVESFRMENDRLYLNAKFPKMLGGISVYFQSISKEAETDCLSVEIEEDHMDATSRKVVFVVDFLKYTSTDAYKMVIDLGGHTFGAFVRFDSKQKVNYSLEVAGTSFAVMPLMEADGSFSIQLAEKFYPYLVSIVTAVYNTKPFLHDMISSVLKQDLGVLQNCQYRSYENAYELILVDDGATDGSSEILDSYAAAFDNVKVIHKENGGVSSARNLGIEKARGKYINFADSDDMLTENFLQETVTFFEEHEEEVDIVTTPIVFFDAAKGDHWTNYKFEKKNKVIDLKDKPDAITLFVGATLFKKESFTNLFDTNLVNGEDIEFIYGILNRGNQKVGAVSTCQYLYRRRSIGEPSAIDGMKKDPRTYSDYLDNVLLRIIKNGIDENGKVPKYIQHNIMGQLQWRFRQDGDGAIAIKTLGEEEYNIYRTKAFELLKYIDDDVIMDQKFLWNEQKYFLLKKKHSVECSTPQIVRENNEYWMNAGGNVIKTSLSNSYVRFHFMTIQNACLNIEGYAMSFEKDFEFAVYVNDKKITYETVDRDINGYSMGEICYYATPFKFELPLSTDEDVYKVEFYTEYKDIKTIRKVFRYTKTMPLAETYNKSYYMADGWAIRKEDNAFIVRNIFSEDNQINYEGEFTEEVKNKKKCRNADYFIALRQQARTLIGENNGKRKICLLSDRTNVAGDNGEALFRYLYEKKDPQLDCYFVINKDCADYENLKAYGKVIARGSKLHQIMHLAADLIISSGADEYIVNPWTNETSQAEVFRDLLARSRYVFLQHGIIKDDLSTWLNKYNKNMSGFVTTTPREAQSILDYEYYYSPDEVWMTGLPRHDRLYHNEKNHIVIMPTWRNNLSLGGEDNKLVENFTDSEYFKFYNQLINDNRLLEAADQYGYKICFMPHPGIKRNGLKLFAHDKRVQFLGFDIEYRDMFSEAVLVMTDYSSTVMDFALLRKPVVYCQFDREEFFENHIYKPGYFDYEEDGFGEVTYDMESLINVMIEYMKDDCKVHEPYRSRMDAFFKYNDKNNCERVYDKIKNLIEA